MLVVGLVAGFFLPGFLMSKLLGIKANALSSFLVSCVLLFQTIFWIDVFRVQVCFTSVLGVLLALSALLFVLVMKFQKTGPGKILDTSEFTFDFKFSPFMIPLGLVVLLILVRSVLQPFNYSDAEFRWNHFALKLMEFRNFNFYPPLTSGDFMAYFYVDGIPPMVSFSYFWIYSSYGVPETMLTGPFVALQLGLILWLAFKITSKLFPYDNSGFYASLVLASSTLFFFSLVMGQETGLTALSLAATVHYLVEKETGDFSSMILAGFATALGALTREYGCAFLFCGIAVCLWRRNSWKLTSAYVIAVLILVSPWYLRTWVVAGNPFYSISSFGGIFNVNEVHCGIFKVYEEYFGFSNQPLTKLYYLLTSLLFTAPVQASIGIAAAVFHFRKHGYLAVSILAVAVLWICSVGQTNGGFFHSMRVLSPALVLLSAASGALLAKWAAGNIGRNAVNVGLGAFFIFAFLQDLTVPYNFWSLKPSEIAVAAFDPVDYVGNRIFSYIEPLPDNAKVISDSPFYHAALSSKPQRGIILLPVWSPELSFLFKEGAAGPKIAELKKNGIGFIMLEKGSLNNKYLEKFPFFRDFRSYAKPYVMENNNCLIYQLYE